VQQLSLSARPRRFKQLIGQQKVSTELRNYFAEHNDLPQAMLFQGPSGTGKTSCARICAVSLECVHGNFGSPCKDCTAAFLNPQMDSGASFDITEINCAAHGLDKLKEILSGHVYAPAHEAQNRVYILDELQAISSVKAQNFLLKIIEDAPVSTKFIFCTTSPDEIIETITNRCIAYTFRTLSAEETLRLVETLLMTSQSDLDPAVLADLLDEHRVTSPRAITQAAQKYLSGAQPEDAVQVASGGDIDTLRVCRHVRSGAWAKCVAEIGDLDANQARRCRIAVAGYMASILREEQNESVCRLASKAIARLTQITRVDDSLIVAAVIAGLYDCTALFQ
jgi:DNA polymerase III delta prime subunit